LEVGLGYEVRNNPPDSDAGPGEGESSDILVDGGKKGNLVRDQKDTTGGDFDSESIVDTEQVDPANGENTQTRDHESLSLGRPQNLEKSERSELTTEPNYSKDYASF
jgi:hypothetical protein